MFILPLMQNSDHLNKSVCSAEQLVIEYGREAAGEALLRAFESAETGDEASEAYWLSTLDGICQTPLRK